MQILADNDRGFLALDGNEPQYIGEGRSKRRVASCHPEIRHKGHGLCVRCWRTAWSRKNGVQPKRPKQQFAMCHPDRPYLAKGLCGPCYTALNYDADRRRRQRAEQKRTANGSWRNAHLKRTFGISAVEYDELLAKQGGVCAICRNTNPDPLRRLAVDHDHETRRIRGLLCGPCNMRLARAVNHDWLTKAMVYLNDHR